MDNDGTGALAIIPNEARLFGKMAKVMGLVNRVPKSGNNTFHKYRYATADDVADCIREAMAEANLALIVRMGEVKQETIEYESSQKTTKTIRTTIKFDFMFACGDTGAVISSPWVGQVDDNSDKAVSKCATAAEKYFLMKTFIVSAGDEPDADADKHVENAPRVVKWFEEERALHELSERAYVSAYITERNGKGVKELEALIAPRTWSDFADRKAAGMAIKEAAEAKKAAAPVPASPEAIEPTPAESPEIVTPSPVTVTPSTNGAAPLTVIVKSVEFDGEKVWAKVNNRLIDCGTREQFAALFPAGWAQGIAMDGWHATPLEPKPFDLCGKVEIAFQTAGSGYKMVAGTVMEVAP